MPTGTLAAVMKAVDDDAEASVTGGRGGGGGGGGGGEQGVGQYSGRARHHAAQLLYRPLEVEEGRGWGCDGREGGGGWDCAFRQSGEGVGGENRWRERG